MKPVTIQIVQFTVTGKFRTLLILYPFLALHKQFFCISFMSVRFNNKYAFQITDRRSFSPFHIICSNLTLRKSDSDIIHILNKANRLVTLGKILKIFF